MSSCRRFAVAGIEDVAGLLEGAERVGVHHLRPHVAVIARRVMVAGEDMAELLWAGAAAKSRRACRSCPAPARSNARTSRIAEAGWLWNSRSISAEETNSTVAKPWLNLRAAKEALQQVVRQRLAGLVVAGELPQHLRLLLPVLVELRGQFDEIGEHAGAGQRGIGHVRQHAVQAVAEFVEQGAGVVRRQQRGLAVGALGEVADIDDQRRDAPSSFCWSRSEVIQAPERFEGRAK